MRLSACYAISITRICIPSLEVREVARRYNIIPLAALSCTLV